MVTGYAVYYLKHVVDNGPRAFYDAEVKSGSAPLEAYFATCKEFVEGLPVGKTFGRREGHFQPVELTSNSGRSRADQPISAPEMSDTTDSEVS